MTDTIIEIADEILLLTKKQSEKLASDDFEGVSSLLNKRAALITKLNRALDGGKLPREARTAIEQAMKLADTQINNTESRHAELKHEFAELKQVFESISAYENSSIDFANTLGFEYDGQS